jgi:hypothetical protein
MLAPHNEARPIPIEAGFVQSLSCNSTISNSHIAVLEEPTDSEAIVLEHATVHHQIYCPIHQ